MTIELRRTRHTPSSLSLVRVIESDPVPQSTPANVNPIEWHQSLGLARQACARIFRDGGSPADALAAFGVGSERTSDWARAVELVALSLVGSGARRAA